jgi:hypothetical protein
MIRIKTNLTLLAIFILFSCKIFAQLEATKLYITDGLDNAKIKSEIETNASLLLTAMGKATMNGTTPDLSKIKISQEASKTLYAMWQSSEMVCPVSEVRRICLKRPDGGFQVRDIPITMLEAPINDQKQDLVINFTKEGTIEDIFNGIPYTQIIAQNISVDDLSKRLKIIDFVEKFKTAYNTRDLDFLKLVFSENALIITGKVVKVYESTDKPNVTVAKEKIEYVTQTKSRYIAKMKVIFATNKYINIEFSDYIVMQHPHYPEIYGVTFKQYWNTSNYKDTGYVFLMIDFEDEDNPIIHVRTWQPDEYNGEKLKREEIFTIMSFKIAK